MVKEKKPPGRHPLEVGTERVYTNGYTYIRTTSGWKLKHHVVAEQNLGRALRPNERAIFKDGDRRNLHPDNIQVLDKQDWRSKRIEAIVSQIVRLERELLEILDNVVT